MMNNNESPLTIYMDLSKAFDTVDYNILLSKLQFYGLEENAVALKSSYLLRVQCVSYEMFNSVHRPISTGVPQGSI